MILSTHRINCIFFTFYSIESTIVRVFRLASNSERNTQTNKKCSVPVVGPVGTLSGSQLLALPLIFQFAELTL